MATIPVQVILSAQELQELKAHCRAQLEAIADRLMGNRADEARSMMNEALLGRLGRLGLQGQWLDETNIDARRDLVITLLGGAIRQCGMNSKAVVDTLYEKLDRLHLANALRAAPSEDDAAPAHSGQTSQEESREAPPQELALQQRKTLKDECTPELMRAIDAWFLGPDAGGIDAPVQIHGKLINNLVELGLRDWMVHVTNPLSGDDPQVKLHASVSLLKGFMRDAVQALQQDGVELTHEAILARFWDKIDRMHQMDSTEIESGIMRHDQMRQKRGEDITRPAFPHMTREECSEDLRLVIRSIRGEGQVELSDYFFPNLERHGLGAWAKEVEGHDKFQSISSILVTFIQLIDPDGTMPEDEVIANFWEKVDRMKSGTEYLGTLAPVNGRDPSGWRN